MELLQMLRKWNEGPPSRIVMQQKEGKADKDENSSSELSLRRTTAPALKFQPYVSIEQTCLERELYLKKERKKKKVGTITIQDGVKD